MITSPLGAHWKIPSDVRDWRILNTAHFRIHYPTGYEEMAIQAGVFAEEAAERYSRVLRHRLGRVIPVFLFASHQDFAAANIIPYVIDEGTGGFTDFFRSRVVVPFNGDYAALRHVLSHEIVHAFLFDILGDSDPGSMPLWLAEGMAEYLSLGWDDSAETYIRDAVLYGRMPTLAEMHTGRVRGGYMFYKGGQAAMLFIASHWSEEHIGLLVKELKTIRQITPVFESVFGMLPEEFDLQFGKFLRARYARAMRAKVKKDDPRLRRVTFRYRDRVGFNLHPVISPDGKKIAYLTLEKIFPVVVIRPLPGPGVSRKDFQEVKIIIKALRGSDYEEWHPLTTNLSFSPDGKEILVSGRRKGKQAFLILDVEEGEVSRSYEPPFDALQYPVFSPDGQTIYFTGVARGRSDLYGLRLKTGELIRYTDDWSHESSPSVSPEGDRLYYSSNRNPIDPDRSDDTVRHIYRIDLQNPGSPPVRLTSLPGRADNPQATLDGGILFSSNFTGVPNLYRLEHAVDRRDPVDERGVVPVTESPTGIHYSSLRLVKKEKGGPEREVLTFAEFEEGAYEIKVLPSGIDERGEELKDSYHLGAVPILPPDGRTFNPLDYRPPVEGYPVDIPVRTDDLNAPYSPFLSPEGFPMVLISGSEDQIAAFGFLQLSDDTGDHQIRMFVNYANPPSTLNLDLQYIFLKYRPDFFIGAYRQDGTFPISGYLDFSLNSILYNPNFRLLDQKSTGVYGGMEYPLHRFGSLILALEQGRDEKIYRYALPEEREQEDIYQNYRQVNVAYRHDNAVYTIFGPLDGHSFLLSYSFPVLGTGSERELYSFSMQFRFYHMFDGFSSFVFKIFTAAVTGRDSVDYPFRLGGYYALRGYRFLEFEGTKAFLINLEYRFNLMDNLAFSFPGSWSLGLIRGVFFIDAGSAFDDLKMWQGYSRREGVTRDLHLSYGVGIQWVNFLYPVIPGTTMKIEWATPYDLKHSAPPKKWRGQFSVGFSFD